MQRVSNDSYLSTAIPKRQLCELGLELKNLIFLQIAPFKCTTRSF